MSKSPTKRTLDELRKRGAVCQVVERWNPFAKIRQDLFGFIDIVCLLDGAIIGVQATSDTNHAARIKKSLAEPKLRAWLACGGLFQVWSWKQTKGKWTHRVDAIRPVMELVLKNYEQNTVGRITPITDEPLLHISTLTPET